MGRRPLLAEPRDSLLHFRGVAGPLQGVHDGLRVGALFHLHGRGLALEVDGGVFNTRDLTECALDPRRATRSSGHPIDGKLHHLHVRVTCDSRRVMASSHEPDGKQERDQQHPAHRFPFLETRAIGEEDLLLIPFAAASVGGSARCCNGGFECARRPLILQAYQRGGSGSTSVMSWMIPR